MNLRNNKTKSGYLCTRGTAARNYAHRLNRSGTLSILEKSRTVACLINYPKSYTERIKQVYNTGDRSFQSSPGANQREGAWWVCAPRNRWKKSGLTQTEVIVKPESRLRMD
ncbi:hypothetical protein AMECASPLE_037096 [Ameca splendens]|uniref:Uncharacterized protein n=1 Tax=Ameca splendens TaxID=208324 RepID=A0ABV0XWV6_9TELE